MLIESFPCTLSQQYTPTRPPARYAVRHNTPCTRIILSLHGRRRTISKHCHPNTRSSYTGVSIIVPTYSLFPLSTATRIIL